MLPKNILTIDVEDWFMDLESSNWNQYESRVVQNTNKVLKIIDESHNKATFFILGYIGEQFPELIKNIYERGHEIALHGYDHKDLNIQTPREFEEDLVKGKKILENIIKTKIVGYRACNFSLSQKTAWAIDIMKKYNFKYDSSVFPTQTPIYGVPEAPTHPYRISSLNIKKDFPNELFFEIPLSTYRLPFFPMNIPVAGGFYLRFFPYWWIRESIKKINKINKVFVCYLHPWELDPGHPRIKNLKWYHYYHLKTLEKKFIKLVNDFQFISIQEWMSNL